jgi:hypothetical protein
VGVGVGVTGRYTYLDLGTTRSRATVSHVTPVFNLASSFHIIISMRMRQPSGTTTCPTCVQAAVALLEK